MERFKNGLLIANLVAMLAVLSSLAKAHNGGAPDLDQVMGTSLG